MAVATKKRFDDRHVGFGGLGFRAASLGLGFSVWALEFWVWDV